ncbi:MAG: TonB family protein [Glaciecola sp.]|jgi:TonB family protein
MALIMTISSSKKITSILLFCFIILKTTQSQVPTNGVDSIYSVAYLEECSLTVDNDSKLWCTRNGLENTIKKQYVIPLVLGDYSDNDSSQYPVSFTVDRDGSIKDISIQNVLNDTVLTAIKSALKSVVFYPAKNNDGLNTASKWNVNLNSKKFNSIRASKKCVLQPDSCRQEYAGSSPNEFVGKMPTLPGCDTVLFEKRHTCTGQKIQEYIMSNFDMPKLARKKGSKGVMYVNFVVDKKGEVINIKILKSISDELDKEAIRVINALPKFNPGSTMGILKSVAYTIPIRIGSE